LGKGNDALKRGADLDMFIFNTAPAASSDNINDFAVA
jgi:hypothetical protein